MTIQGWGSKELLGVDGFVGHCRNCCLYIIVSHVCDFSFGGKDWLLADEQFSAGDFLL